MNPGTLGQNLADQFKQRLNPLAGQCGDCHHRFIRPRRDLLSQLRCAIFGQQVPLVPGLNDRHCGGRPFILDQIELAQDFKHLAFLRRRIGIGDIADVDDHIGRHNLFKRGPKRRDQLGRQIGNETDRVGQDRLVHAGQPDPPHGRIKRGEQQIFGHYRCPGQPVEQRAFSGIGIANQGDHRPRCFFAPAAMQAAGAADLIEFAAQLCHPVADQAAIGFDLGFARAAQKAEAAALAFKVSPAAHQSPGLIVKMRQLHLQAPFGSRCAFAENFKDQPGAVDHLALQLLLKIALLDGGQRAVDDDQSSVFQIAGNIDVLDLPFAEQRPGPRLADRNGHGVNHDQPDRQREPAGLFEACSRIDARAAAHPEFRVHDHGPRPAGYFAIGLFAKDQSSSPWSASPVRSTGVTG